MSVLSDLERLLPSLSRAEKARLLHDVARDLGAPDPGVTRTPGICGGDACIVRTRVPVWTLIHARSLGTSDTDLLRAYPSLRPEDLLHAFAYADAHPQEIASAIAENLAA